MTYRSLVAAELAFDGNGTPYAPAYGDVYHSAAGGLEQARHVFLGGNDLLGENARWGGRETFTIMETGFGPGLNFLATWQAWEFTRNDPRRCRRLHFVSVEKHPFAVADVARLHERWPELAPLAARLRVQWPLPLPGLHRLHFDDVTLTLAFGDAGDLLPQLVALADAFFLDGFSPERNPDLWSDAIVAQLRRLAAPGATLATGVVTDDVVRRLASADFTLQKRRGLRGKSEMLTGYLRDAAGSSDTGLAATDRRVTVIGAGIAGTSIAERLAARGMEVTLLDAAPGPAAGASGNPVGIIRPLPSLDDNRLSRWIRAGYLHAARHLQALQDEGLPIAWARCGVLHLARDAKHEATQRRAIAEQAPPPAFARFVERDEAARLAGWPVDTGGWWFAGGAWIAPPSLCRANLLRHGERIVMRFDATVARIEHVGGLWRVFDNSGDGGGVMLAEAPRLVLAAGAHVQRLIPDRLLPVWTGRGTVSLLPAAATPPLDIVACRLGYVTPAVDGIRCAGATMARDGETEPRAADHAENLLRLDMILPGFGKSLDASSLAGRTSFRPMSPDRLPLAGALPASLPAPAITPAPAASAGNEGDGLFVLSGFGARGLVWSALAAELLASRIGGEPLPVEADLAAASDPARFLARPPPAPSSRKG